MGSLWLITCLPAYYVLLLLTAVLNAHQYADANQAMDRHQFSTITDGEHVANTLNRILIAHS